MPIGRSKLKRARPSVRREAEAPPEKSTPTRRLEFEPLCRSPSCPDSEGSRAVFAPPMPPMPPQPERLDLESFDNETEERDIIRTAAVHSDVELFSLDDPMTSTMQDVSLSRNPMRGALPETPEDGLMKIDADVVLGRYETCGTGSGEHRQYEELILPPPLIGVTGSKSNSNKRRANAAGETSGKEAEEDVPLLPEHRSTEGYCLGESDCLDTSHGAPFAVGMHVEARWGCRWFPGTVLATNRNGYVQVRWDEDGSFLQLRPRDVRHVTPVLAASQLVTERKEENDAPEFVGDAGKSDKHIVLYLSSAARAQVSEERCTAIDSKPDDVCIGIVEAIAVRGAIVANTLKAVESAIASHPQMSLWFIVANDTSGDVETPIAHAMGVAALSVDWLLRLSATGAFARNTLPTPTVRDSLGCTHGNDHAKTVEGNEPVVSVRPLSRASRLLFDKVVYVAGTTDMRVTTLLAACGAVVTRVLPESSTPHALHYVYVALGTALSSIDSCFPSVAPLEHEQLLHRVHDFFLSHSRSLSPSVPPGTAHGDDDAPIGAKGICEDLCDAVRTPPQREGSRVRVAAGGRFDVVEGEDYYFRTARTNNINSSSSGNNNYNYNSNADNRVAADVLLGRIVHAGPSAAHVTLRLYEVKQTALRQNARTGEVERQTIVFLSERAATVPVENLIFETPVYVVSATQMQHVYTLESPPGEEAEDNAPRLSLSTVQNTALNEVVVNGWRICPGVTVRFYNPLTALGGKGKGNREHADQGRVEVIQRAANGVVLIVHTLNESRRNSRDAGEVKVVAITPDMVTGIV